MKSWSKELQDSTREALENYSMQALNGKCYMKKWLEKGSCSGIISVFDILNSNWIIKNTDDKSEILATYESIDELIADGWVLD